MAVLSGSSWTCISPLPATHSFSTYLAFELSNHEATVIEKNLQTRTNPSPDSPALSELDEGQIVDIEDQIGQWVRVRTQRGHIGWVPQKSILSFKGY